MRIPWNKGIPQSKEAKEKNRIAHIGKTPWNKGKHTPLSEENKENIKKGLADLKGIPRSEEVKRKISEAGKRAYAEGRRINPNKGKHLSESHRLRIGLAHKGKKLSKEHIKKLSKARRRGIQEGRIKPWNKGKSIQTNTGRTLFKKGQKTWNKGIPMSEEAKRKMIEKKLEMYKAGKIKIWNKGKHLPLEIRKKLSAKLQGIPIEKWKKFVSYEPYGDKFNKKLKEKIRKRDNYQCQLCGKPQDNLKERLIIHHIDYDKKNNGSINLISLCHNCHAKTNFNRKKWYNQLIHLNAINFWKRLFGIKKDK